MKATFIHDFSVFSKDGDYYTFGGFPSSMWDRYLSVANNLTVICRKKGEPSNYQGYRKSNKENVNIIPVGKFSNFIKIKDRSEVSKIIKEEIKNSDFVIIRLPSLLGLASYKYVKKYNKPYIVEVVGHGFKSYFYQGKFLGKFLAPLIHYKMKRIVKKANLSIYVTNNFLQCEYPSKNQVGISNAEITKKLTDRSINNKKLNEKEFLRIGFMGAVNIKYKNFYKTLCFLEKYSKKKNKQIIVELAGGGESKKINRLSKSSTSLTIVQRGRLKNSQEVNDWFKTLDLFIHPSLTEGLPRVVLEAMCNQVPVIASNVGGTGEIIDEKFLFNPMRERSFNKALHNILHCFPKVTVEYNYDKLELYKKEVLQKKRINILREFVDKEIL